MKRTDQIVSVDKKTGRVRVQSHNILPTKTQQNFKDECDINNIMAQYSKTGQFTHVTSRQGQYADFSNITDYQEMLDTVRYADQAFMTLPAQIRSRFGNDPGQLLAFVQDSKNYDEGVKLGLVQPKQAAPTTNDDSNDDKKPAAKTPKPQPKNSQPELPLT